MAVKRCPTCQQTLPVACKSCPCGHIFITKKCHISKDSEDEKNEQLPLKRLRPEKPKREIPDFDYDDYTRASLNIGGDAQLKTFSQRIYAENYDDDHFSLVSQNIFERSDSFEDGMRPAKKKRGRPKGSKNKPKNGLLAGICGENYNNPSQLFSNCPRKPGRPKGSKNKVNPDLDGDSVPIKVQAIPNKLPPVPQEKVVSYSLILSDINEKLMSQNKIKRLLGI